MSFIGKGRATSFNQFVIYNLILEVPKVPNKRIPAIILNLVPSARSILIYISTMLPIPDRVSLGLFVPLIVYHI
jgi:hypothetical protein